MSLRIMRLMIAVALCLAGAERDNPGQAEQHSSYCHGYYLFLAGMPNGCEDCYVPLLLTRKTVEKLAQSPKTEDSVLITTYERDSMWHYDGLVQIAQSDINTTERKLRLSNRSYRYQETAAAEVLRLLENPSGKIPISRPYLPAKLPAGPELDQLISDFKAVK